MKCNLLHSNIFAIQEPNLQNSQNVKAGMPWKNSGTEVEELGWIQQKVHCMTCCAVNSLVTIC